MRPGLVVLAAVALTAAGVAVAQTAGTAFEDADGVVTACVASPPAATEVGAVLSDPKGGGVRIVKAGESCAADETPQQLLSPAALARTKPLAIFASDSANFLDKKTVVTVKLPAGSFLVHASVELAPPSNGLIYPRIVVCRIVNPAGKEVAESKRTTTLAKGTDAPFLELSTQALFTDTEAGDAKVVCGRIKGGGRPLTATASISAHEVRTEKAAEPEPAAPPEPAPAPARKRR